jgi:hypothetical protein
LYSEYRIVRQYRKGFQALPKNSKTYVILGSQRWLYRLLKVFTRRQVILLQDPPASLVDKSNQFSLYDYSKAMGEQAQMQRALEEYLSNSKFLTAYRGRFTQRQLVNVLLQHVYRNYRPTIPFARLCQKILKDEQLCFVIPAPKLIRNMMNESGIPVSGFFSQISWEAAACRLFFSGLLGNAKGFIRNLYDFMTHPRESREMAPDVFWFGLAITDFGGGERELNIVNYVEERRLPFLKDSKKVFLLSDWVKTPEAHHHGRILVDRNPFRVPGRRSLGLRRSFLDLWKQIVTTFSLFGSFMRGHWWDLMLAENYAELPRWDTWMKTVKPRHIAWSNNNTPDPLWAFLREPGQFQTWHVFYSTFCTELEFQGEVTENPIPVYLTMLADNFAVWNEEQKAWLEDLGYSRETIHICGPIVFSKFPKKTELKSGNVDLVKIALFDVVPLLPEAFIRNGIGYSYFNMEVLEKFVTEVIDACNKVFGKMNYQILIKPKRYSPRDVPGYWKFLENVVAQNKEVVLLPPPTSPVFAAAEVDLAVSLPVTSPAMIAQYYGVPSCYYDPTGRLANLFYTNKNPVLHQTMDSLVKWLKETRVGHSKETKLDTINL